MGNLVQEIKSKFANHDDFFIHEERINHTAIFLMGYKTLINFTKSKLYVRQMAELSASVDELFINLSDQLDVKAEQLIRAIIEGKLVVLSEKNRNAIMETVPQTLSRSIEEPKNENPLQGPFDAFGEDVDMNIGLIRKRLSTDRLHHCSYQVGELAKRRVSILYINGTTPSTLIEKIVQKLKQIETDIQSLEDLNKHLGYRKFIPVSHLFVTEIPIQAVHSLKKSRVVLFLDNYPSALVFPHLFWDMFVTENDRNFPFVLSFMVRTLRVIGALATLILPGLYVALTSVNPDVLRIDLALFVAESREGIPLTPLIETLTMLVLIDLTIEAILRLPKSIGSTVTMVGGIILGQAMVEAKLVSQLLVIVIAAMVIAASTIVGVQNSLYIRSLKYFILFAASIFGILGIFTGLLFICILLASLTTFDIPYMAFRFPEKGDSQ